MSSITMRPFVPDQGFPESWYFHRRLQRRQPNVVYGQSARDDSNQIAVQQNLREYQKAAHRYRDPP
jgi:hypothetical protein